MKKININYWNGSPDNNYMPNFGDDLNPFLIGKLSGHKTQYKILGKKERLKKLFSLRFKEFKEIEMPWERTIIPVGSIINRGNRKSIIWGSGFMKTSENYFNGGQTLAVRGKLTDEKLQQLGFPGCSVYGDPALLLPLIVQPSVEKQYNLGLIPHWTETDKFKEKYGNDYKIIDLRSDDIPDVVKQITSCKYILSTSLHGIIVSHAYNIPSLWIKEGYIHTDGFKFKDYFSSVDIPFYDGFTEINEILNNEDSWLKLFIEHKELSLIHKSIENIQKELLKVAPFPLTEKYKRFIKS